MDYRAVETTDEYVARLSTGADWRAEIEALAEEVEADAGWFTALGSVRDAEMWFYDQEKKEYEPVYFDEHLEVAACVGNVSILDGERFAHTHAVLSRPDGTALAGHLDSAEVFAGEVHFRKFAEPLERAHHEPTDLDLWL
ncbi:hypothetical protein L593_08380 [Salinarchaeum sp. Harcht-Bsk1]|uniref:PPC domain-containing DNA-binding protein n=1 Tax=Salinarchaeum sp. Harcht-Bsk1 TaxID=1333523 RepID=UPI00034240E7|nr:PPC domain-containing DNA-binding protein [Salinarchaeum sp. Harcht-Bsk1]AGN01621.1 hypothetical protein L593_08380 [Salinarchaeum sp. Harcht-Bsk1]